MNFACNSAEQSCGYTLIGGAKLFVFGLLRAKSWLNLRARDEFENAEEANLRWATEWDEAHDEIYAAARREYIKLVRLRIEKLKLQREFTKGRACTQKKKIP